MSCALAQDAYEDAVDLTKPGAYVPPTPRVDPVIQRKLKEMERQLEVTALDRQKLVHCCCAPCTVPRLWS